MVTRIKNQIEIKLLLKKLVIEFTKISLMITVCFGNEGGGVINEKNRLLQLSTNVLKLCCYTCLKWMLFKMQNEVME